MHLYSIAPPRGGDPAIRRLALGCLALVLLIAGSSVPSADAATYSVRQCDPSHTLEHDWLMPTNRPDAFWAEARCAAGALNLNAHPFKTIFMNDGISLMAFAPDGTSFVGWDATFQGGPNQSDGVLLRARVCATPLCTDPGQDVFWGLASPHDPVLKEWNGSGGQALRVEVICTGYGGPDGCSWPLYGPGVAMTNSVVRVNDAFAPLAPQVTGGALLTAGWKRGSEVLNFNASDRGGGVASVSISAGGAVIAKQASACAGPGSHGSTLVWHRLRPCPLSLSGQLAVPLRGLADGAHALTLTATDPAGQVSAPSQVAVQIDNTPPAPPASASVDGGDAWTRTNSFTVRWENPIERFAPIAKTWWRVCPVGGGPCTSGQVATGDVAALKGISVPRDGEHDLSLWLEDAAGNSDEQRPRTVRLRLDTEAPAPVFEAHDPSDPQRVSVLVSDAHSGLAGGEIEMREAGSSTWHELATAVEGPRLVAYVDDEAFRLGDYEFRARAVDAAGNEASTDRRAGGARMTLRLPLRIETRLTAGAQRRVPRRGKRPRIRLVSSIRAPYGSKTKIVGTLTDLDDNPLDSATISVFSRPRTSAGEFSAAGIVRTDHKGRFVYLVRAGASRVLRFRYAGSRRIVGRTTDVTLRVPSTSTIRASRKRLIVGDTVMFSGRLRTRPVPPGGKLVEIQSYFRSRWRTFSTVRTDAAGRWRFSYQFSGTVGTVRYPFRVWLPFESGYPFESGPSPRISVLVRGL